MEKVPEGGQPSFMKRHIKEEIKFLCDVDFMSVLKIFYKPKKKPSSRPNCQVAVDCCYPSSTGQLNLSTVCLP